MVIDDDIPVLRKQSSTQVSGGGYVWEMPGGSYVESGRIKETTSERHFPLLNYMGPGTHIVERINNRIMPVGRADAAAMVHDINYLRFAGDEEAISRADDLFIRESGFGLQGVTGKVGILLKKTLFPGAFSDPLPNHSKLATNQIGQVLKDKVLNDPDYSMWLKAYDLNFD